MEALFIENQYRDIGPVTAGRYQADIGMAVSGHCSTVLADVLNKAINAVSEAEYNTCVAQNQNAPIGAERFYKQYRSHIQIAVLLFLLGILLLVAVFQFRLYRIAYHDKLTHCKNGSYLLERGNRLIKRGRFTYIVSLDVKKMKQINDSYGMNTGNDILAFVAVELKKRLPKGGRVIRNTADNFVLLLPARGMTQQCLMDKLTKVLMELRDYQQGEVSVKLYFSVGICRIQRSQGLSESLNHADIARKTAKEAGRAVLFFDEEVKAKMNREREIEDNMEQALENQEFEVYYQPKFHMGTGEIVGAEALVRWNSPCRGVLSPIEFIPIFEKNGFVMQLDFYVLKHVCATQRHLLEAGVRPLPVSVNQSRTHINDPQYVEKLRRLISEYRLPSGLLELELTEYLFMENESVVGTLHKIKDMGLLLSIDDFGSGYSSLNLLRDIPIDYLKIDKGFLRELQLSDKTKAILTRIIQMANDLRITPVCEGVETREQAELLKNMGCLLCQGYLYARPMPEKEYLKLAYHLEGAAAYV